MGTRGRCFEFVQTNANPTGGGRDSAVVSGLACFPSWVFGGHQAKGCPAMLLGLGGVEVGDGLVFGVLLAATPLHEQAVAQAAKHAHDPQARTEADAAAV